MANHLESGCGLGDAARPTRRPPPGKIKCSNQDVRFSDSIQRLTLLLEQTPNYSCGARSRVCHPRCQCYGKIVYFLFGNPEDVGQIMEAAIAAGKVPIVNLDLAAGLSRDQAAVSYLAHRQVKGIISTHPEPLRAARDFGLFAIKRTFLLDSAALHSALRSLDQFLPDALGAAGLGSAAHPGETSPGSSPLAGDCRRADSEPA